MLSASLSCMGTSTERVKGITKDVITINMVANSYYTQRLKHLYVTIAAWSMDVLCNEQAFSSFLPIIPRPPYIASFLSCKCAQDDKNHPNIDSYRTTQPTKSDDKLSN